MLVVLCVLSLLPASSSAAVPCKRIPTVMTLCEARFFVEMAARAKTDYGIHFSRKACRRIHVRAFRCRPVFFAGDLEWYGVAILSYPRNPPVIRCDFRLTRVNGYSGKRARVHWRRCH
ncbi:MAG: hypothetical protein Q8O56_13980 [Solirubrobacteraceae bacterium]|nr:hypothetical protein [Solirubrobacteraceae bacterium]